MLISILIQGYDLDLISNKPSVKFTPSKYFKQIEIQMLIENKSEFKIENTKHET
jgi:hypothetical protein